MCSDRVVEIEDLIAVGVRRIGRRPGQGGGPQPVSKSALRMPPPWLRLLNFAASWGRSSAGRASRSQCEGREFDPPRLHQHPNKIK